MLILQNISFSHPNKDLLFDDITLTAKRQEKIALIGNNGTGKSTLLKIIAGDLLPKRGERIVAAQPYYIPQIFGQYNHLTIAQALKIDQKLSALKEILNGAVTEENYTLLEDDWTIEDRCKEALQHWELTNLNLSQKVETLSGGQKTKVFLAGISIFQPELIVMDEPTNHLDISGRQLLYDFIQATRSTLIVVSHDRKLLSLLHSVYELTKNGIKLYGGNYEFYKEQKEIENNALIQNIQSKEKALRKAKEKARETVERRKKLDNRGKSKQEKAGVARIMMNTLRNKAEHSTTKLNSVHEEKIDGLSQDLKDLRSAVPDIEKMKIGFDDSELHKGKILFTAMNLNYAYNTQLLWKENLHFQITSGERIALKGANGSGKTTLVRLMLKEIQPAAGSIALSDSTSSIYIDQDYSSLDKQLKVYEQAQSANSSGLQEHEVNIRLNRFLFTKEDWNKPCAALSGGERMRLILCCLSIKSQSPDLIMLDEPTNNLDIQSLEILTNAIREYKGTLIVVSHDEVFLENINIQRVISLS